MSHKQKLPVRVTSSKAVHDFKLIRGVGTVIEKQLHTAGIQTFSQLARRSPEEIAVLTPHVSVKQIREQGWIRQARKLANHETAITHPQKEPASPASHQRYENFTLEFLLTEKNKIRRMRLTHVQSGDVDTWAEWNPDDVSRFISRHTGTRLRAVPTVGKPEGPNYVQPTINLPEPKPEGRVVELSESMTSREMPAPIITSQPLPPAAAIPSHNQVRIRKWVNALPDSNEPIRSIIRGQQFEVRLILDLDKPSTAKGSVLDITGTLFAKVLGVGGGTRQIIAQSTAAISAAPVIEVIIASPGLTKGLYRLDATIKVGPTEVISCQGGLFQVY